MTKILVIADDIDINEATVLILSSAGYEVISAYNFESGDEMAMSENPDLIILDVMMDEPDDGFFLAQKLREENFSNPIIMYTSVANTIGLQFGNVDLIPVNEFIEKPISPNDLISKVQKLLDEKN